jgi:curved DNA-binding protein CbpA
MTDSKIFVGLRPPGKKPAPQARASNEPECQWDGCEKAGTHRAPVGRDGEGLFLLFCPEHARQYNRGYNYAADQSDPVVARYQREAASGRRKTWGTNSSQPSETPLPSTARSGSAKAINARKSAQDRQAAKVDLQRRKLKVLEARAFEGLGLSPEATPAQINRRYKERLKMFHPDANGGNRGSEEELQASIEAYRILKLNGFC